MAQTDQQDFSAFEGTRPVAEQQKFDIGALEAWMREHVAGFAGRSRLNSSRAASRTRRSS